MLTCDYGLASWLAFYLPSHPPVEQINGRIRYVNSPEPDPALFRGPIMYVCIVDCADMPLVQRRFKKVELVAAMSADPPWRADLQQYRVYRLSGSDRAAA